MTDCSSLWYGVHSEDQRDERASIQRWEAVAGKLGWTIQRPFLLGIRGVKLGATMSSKTLSKAEYDDSFCLYYPGNGVYFFAGSTHAYQVYSKLSPDVNGDGVGDVATIVPGRYVLTWKMDDGARCPIFEVTNQDGSKLIECRRDVDHDGVAEAGPYRASAVLFHSGYDAPPGADHRSSIACQTTGKASLLAMKLAGHVIDYVLVTAEQAVELFRGLPDFRDTDPSPPPGSIV